MCEVTLTSPPSMTLTSDTYRFVVDSSSMTWTIVDQGRHNLFGSQSTIFSIILFYVIFIFVVLDSITYMCNNSLHMKTFH